MLSYGSWWFDFIEHSVKERRYELPKVFWNQGIYCWTRQRGLSFFFFLSYFYLLIVQAKWLTKRHMWHMTRVYRKTTTTQKLSPRNYFCCFPKYWWWYFWGVVQFNEGWSIARKGNCCNLWFENMMFGRFGWSNPLKEVWTKRRKELCSDYTYLINEWLQV